MSGVLRIQDYALEYSASEAKRLMAQASILKPITLGLLERAGITRGMRVLDLGCGVGDVSFLAATMVGPSGSVIGIDREHAALEFAEARRVEMDVRQVSFHQASLDDIHLDGEFDAVIGRCILMHLRDPGATLRHVARLVRPGGVIAFQEIGAHLPRLMQSLPLVPLWNAMGVWIADALAATGARVDAGGRFVQLFAEACLPRPQVTCESPVDGGPHSPFYAWLAETVRTLVPRIVTLGIATASEIDIETLEERVRESAIEVKSQLVGPPQFCAWTRKPATDVRRIAPAAHIPRLLEQL